MFIIGCDFHAGFQSVAILEAETGEIRELQLGHRHEAEQFYGGLRGAVRVGIEACGYSQWFERMLAEMGHELWIGDASQIRASAPRKQKTDKRDAAHLLKLLLEERFPRIWVPSPEERDLRQLLLHRHSRVRERTRVKNQLHAIAINQGLRLRRQLWTRAGRQQLEALPLAPFAAQRRQELLRRLDELDRQMDELNRTVEQEGARRPAVPLLRTHPGVGPVLALAFVVTVGPVERFGRARELASYFGLIPSEYSSGGYQRLGRITKQGNALLRFLLVEAGQSAVRKDLELRQAYGRIARKTHRAVAKVAVARKLALRMYWMLRRKVGYPAVLKPGSVQASPSHPVVEV
jgi:transposase